MTANCDVYDCISFRHEIIHKLLDDSDYDPMIAPNYEDGKKVLLYKFINNQMKATTIYNNNNNNNNSSNNNNQQQKQ